MVTLFKNFPLPAFVIQDGCIQFFNRCFLEYTGHKELAGTPFILLVHPQDRQMVNESLRKVLEDEDDLSCEFRLLVNDGHDVYVLGFFSRITFKEKLAVTGQIVDVTEYKNAIDELQKAKVRYKDLFENINDVIYTHELNRDQFISL